MLIPGYNIFKILMFWGYFYSYLFLGKCNKSICCTITVTLFICQTGVFRFSVAICDVIFDGVRF